MSMRRIYSIEMLPVSGCDEVEMRVDVNRSSVDIMNILEKLIDWCLIKGVKKVKLNDMSSVKIARKLSQDQLDVEYDEKNAVWNTNDSINYII